MIINFNLNLIIQDFPKCRNFWWWCTSMMRHIVYLYFATLLCSNWRFHHLIPGFCNKYDKSIWCNIACIAHYMLCVPSDVVSANYTQKSYTGSFELTPLWAYILKKTPKMTKPPKIRKYIVFQTFNAILKMTRRYNFSLT